ncbi:MAG: chemotaxis protein CheB [Bacteroidota bacterium]|nr:chemotaxis protein CheB [Bacteroidota bacterium]
MAKTNKTKILSKNLFPVVGIGASAGGLEAFKRLVKAIPENSGIAYILVQHLHPDHSSSLPDILQRETAIPVNEISNNVKVEPDKVYIIPANKMLVATDGVLKLSPRPKDHKNMPIDIFFSSLAEVHQSHAIGIVLSGNGADGTVGLRDIKDHGGITFAQDLESAAYDSMPQSAIKSGVVDFILSPEEMPKQLLKLNDTYKILPSSEHATPKELTEEESFKQILSILRINNGVDFTYYKQTTIRRRILRRMVILKLEKIADYQAYLKQNKTEQDTLFQDVLIPVTSFFRDPKIFEHLCHTVLPELIKEKSSVNPLRIWVAGCSIGKEAYSIGMCIHEYLSNTISNTRIQIFATDVSEKSIAKARTGVYNKSEMEGVSEDRIKLFFTKTNESYQVNKAIRDMCVFATHNFLKDPPFAKIDLISCRNVLIYLEPFLQKKAFTIFHYALNPKGYLWLGKSETAGSSSDYFLPSGVKDKFYTRKSFPGRFMNVASESREETLKDKDYGLRVTERKKDDFQKDADDIILSKYTPPGVIVNDQLDIVQFRGSTGDFLEPSPGKASLNVLKMARDGLSFEIRNALQKSKTTKTPFIKQGIPINNGQRVVSIEVVPLLNSIELYFLILFTDTTSPNLHDGDKVKNAAGVKKEENIRIQQLEKDLSQVREDMRSITEEQEAVNEELQSANEELLSGSEELQSLNEELETSKEELQSTNEELITVNQELYERNEQYNEARLYAEAIVSTIHEPLIVIGNDFKIKSANKSFYKIFHLTEEETIGTILFDLQNNGWNIPGLRSQLLKIHKEKEKFIEWEVTYTFPEIGNHTICFNAQPVQKENGENWILLALDDISVEKEKERNENKILEDLRNILENIPQLMVTRSKEGYITFCNKNFLEYSGLTLAKAINQQGWESIIKPTMIDEVRKSWGRSIANGEEFQMELELKRKSTNTYRWHLCRSLPFRNEEGSIISWVGTATDIHNQKTKDLVKDEFISIASHELKTPLTTAKAYIQLLQMSLEETSDKDLIFAQKAGASIDRLNDLIGELMDLSKIQNGKLNFQITTFNFNEIVLEALESVQYSSPSHHILLSGEIKKPIKGDKERLKQVVINLLNNAVKYSPNAKDIFINLVKDKDCVKVSVKDNGIGIRKQNLEKIFERYYREEQRAAHFQGLGIGLYISHEIIQSHHGKIWAESEPGKGSTFYFTIPI